MLLAALTLALVSPAMPVAEDDGDKLICRAKIDTRTRMRTGSKTCKTKAEWRGDYAEEDAALAKKATAPETMSAQTAATPPKF